MFSLPSFRKKQSQLGDPPLEASSESLLFSDPRAAEYLHQLVLGFVHKHNNFLTITQGFTDLLLSETKDHETRQNLETVANSARNAVDLNAKVIACASADQPQQRSINLREFLTERESRFCKACSEKQVILSLGDDNRPAFALIDPMWLDLILDELVANANEAQDSSVVSLSLIISPNLLSVRLHNNGEPIGPESLSKAFSPFYSTKDRSHLGIGLTRAGTLAEKMGCQISLRRHPKGTEAEIRFPATEAGAS